MDKQDIVVTFKASPEQKELLLEVLGSEAPLTFLKEVPAFMAGIDAWWTEPFSHGTFRMEYPFLDLPNVLGSPHNSAVVSHVLMDAMRQATENVKRFLKGEKVLGIARREDYLG